MNWIAAFDWPQTLALAATSCLVVSGLAVLISSQLRNYKLHLKHQILLSALLACGMAAGASLSITAVRWTPFSVPVESAQSSPAVAFQPSLTPPEALGYSKPATQPSIQAPAPLRIQMESAAKPTQSIAPDSHESSQQRKEGWLGCEAGPQLAS